MLIFLRLDLRNAGIDIDLYTPIFGVEPHCGGHARD